MKKINQILSYQPKHVLTRDTKILVQVLTRLSQDQMTLRKLPDGRYNTININLSLLLLLNYIKITRKKSILKTKVTDNLI